MSWTDNYALQPVTAMVAAAATLGLAPHEVFAQQEGMDIRQMMAKKADAGEGKKVSAYGFRTASKEDGKVENNFDAAEELKDSDFILIHGYNGCKYCDKIGENVGKIRKALDAGGRKDVKIVVVNVHPADDASKLAEYAAIYREKGVYKEGDFGKRFFIVFPKDSEEAKKWQVDTKADFDPQDPEKLSHNMKIVAVKKDGTIASGGMVLGTQTGKKSDALVAHIAGIYGVKVEKGPQR